MGLDMYLHERVRYREPRYINFETCINTPDREKFSIKRADSLELLYEVGYWRKAYAIHGWFERLAEEKDEEFGNGVDFAVTLGELKGLKTICERLRNSIGLSTFEDLADELLPEWSRYDDSYEERLGATIEIIDSLALNENYDDNSEFIYSASW